MEKDQCTVAGLGLEEKLGFGPRAYHRRYVPDRSIPRRVSFSGVLRLRTIFHSRHAAHRLERRSFRACGRFAERDRVQRFRVPRRLDAGPESVRCAARCDGPPARRERNPAAHRQQLLRRDAVAHRRRRQLHPRLSAICLTARSGCPCAAACRHGHSRRSAHRTE